MLAMIEQLLYTQLFEILKNTGRGYKPETEERQRRKEEQAERRDSTGNRQGQTNTERANKTRTSQKRAHEESCWRCAQRAAELAGDFMKLGFVRPVRGQGPRGWMFEKVGRG